MGGGFSKKNKKKDPTKVEEITADDAIGRTDTQEADKDTPKSARGSQKESANSPRAPSPSTGSKGSKGSKGRPTTPSHSNKSKIESTKSNVNQSWNDADSFDPAEVADPEPSSGPVASTNQPAPLSRTPSKRFAAAPLGDTRGGGYSPRSPRSSTRERPTRSFDNMDDLDIDEKEEPKRVNSFNINQVTLKDQMKKKTARIKIEWQRGQLLGRGAFGSVFLGLNNKTGALMAVKQITLSSSVLKKSGPGYERLKALEREISLMSSMCHPHIVEYFGSQVQKPTKEADGTLDIFLEFVPGGSIATLLRNFGKFDEGLVRHYTRQILLGLEYLHRHDIIHRDIKGGNILVDPTGTIKLADFGTSVSMTDLADKKNPSVEGTVSWMAPEVIKQEKQSFNADVWSLGCTVVEMISGAAPWASSDFTNPVALMFHIASTPDPPAIPDILSDAGKDFVQLCLTRDTELRPSAKELLNHPFVLVPDFNKPLSEQTQFPQDGSMQSFQSLFQSHRSRTVTHNSATNKGTLRPPKKLPPLPMRTESINEIDELTVPTITSSSQGSTEATAGGLIDIEASFDENYDDESFLSVQPSMAGMGGSFADVQRFLTDQVCSLVSHNPSTKVDTTTKSSLSKYLSRKKRTFFSKFQGKNLGKEVQQDTRVHNDAW